MRFWVKKEDLLPYFPNVSKRRGRFQESVLGKRMFNKFIADFSCRFQSRSSSRLYNSAVSLKIPIEFLILPQLWMRCDNCAPSSSFN